MEVRNITAELIRSGESLWSQVECEIRRDCVIVYARLCANEGHGVEGALAESERVFNSVLAGRDWLAAVCDLVARAEQRRVEIGVLMDDDRALAPIA
jgi:hypothetical protein